MDKNRHYTIEMIAFSWMYFYWIFAAIIWGIIPTVLGISGSFPVINNTSATQATSYLTSSPVFIATTTTAELPTSPSASPVIQVSSYIKSETLVNTSASVSVSVSRLKNISEMIIIGTSKHDKVATKSSTRQLSLTSSPVLITTNTKAEIPTSPSVSPVILVYSYIRSETLVNTSGLPVPSTSPVTEYTRDVLKSQSSLSSVSFLNNTSETTIIVTSKHQAAARLSTTSLKVEGSSLKTTVNSTVIPSRTKEGTATESETVKTTTSAAETITTTTVAATVTISSPAFNTINSDSELIHVTGNIAFRTDSLKITPLISTKTHSMAAPSPTPDILSRTQTAETNGSTYFLSFHGTDTISSPSQTEESTNSLFVTSTTSYSSVQGNESSTGAFSSLESTYVFSSQRLAKTSIAFSYYLTETDFSSKPYLTPSSKVNEQYSISDTYGTLNVTETFKLSSSSARSLTSIASSRNSITWMFSAQMVQNKTSLIQMLSPNSFVISKSPDMSNAPTTSVRISVNSTTIGSSSLIFQSNTSSLLSSSYSEVLKSIAISSEVNATKIIVLISDNTLIMESSLRFIKNKTSMTHTMAYSTTSTDANAFSTVDILRTSIEVYQNGTVMRTPSPIVHKKTSMIHVILSSASYKTSAFSSGVDATRTSAVVSQTFMWSSLPLVQSKTPSTLMLAFSEIISATRMRVTISQTRTIFVSSISMVQSKTTAIHISSSFGNHKTKVINVPRTSVGVSPSSTVKSFLPIGPQQTSSIQLIPSSIDLSSGVNIPKTVVSVFHISTVTLSSSHIIHNGTSWMYMLSSSKIFETTTVSSQLNVPITIILSSRNRTNTMLTLPMVQNKTSNVQVIPSSKISKVEKSKRMFSTNNVLGKNVSSVFSTLSEYSSNKLSTTLYVTPTLTSPFQPVSEWIGRPNRTVNLTETSATIQRTLPDVSFSNTKALKRSTVSGGSRLKSLELTVLSTSSPSVVTIGDLITFVSDAVNDTTFMPNYTMTLHGTAVKTSLTLLTTLPLINTTKHQELTSRVASSKLKSANTSTVKYTYSNVRGSSSENFSITRRVSTLKSLQAISTLITNEVMFSSNLYKGYTDTSLLMPGSVYSSQILTSKSSHVMQSLTSLIFSTRKERLGSVAPGSTLTKKNLSKQYSQTSLSVPQMTESITSWLTTTVITSEKRSTFTTSQTITSLTLSQNTVSGTMLLSSQPTLTGVNTTHSTKDTLGLSSIIKASKKQTTFASSSTVLLSLPAPPLTTSTLSSDIVPTSTLAISQSSKITGVNTMISQGFPKSSYSIEMSVVLFSSVNTYTKRLPFSSEPRSTLNSIKTRIKGSSTTPNMTTSFRTFTPTPASSVIEAVQTEPPPENPTQFEGSMVLQMPWNSQYQTTYTPEFQTLASVITKELTKAFKNLEGFLSVQVLRLWKSSVGVDFVVFVRQSVQINESTVENTIIEANNTGVLHLPITSLQVKERKVTTTPSAPTPASKTLDWWVIILIVAGILVFLLLLIICILAVKLAKRSGGFRSQKYEVSRYNDYIYTEYTDSIARSKTNLPVILSMEEKRQGVKEGSHENLSAYNITDSRSEESLSRNVCGTQLQGSNLNINSGYRSTSEEAIISTSAATEEVLKLDEINLEVS